MSHQEERSALLDATGESVADGVGAQVRPVVSDSDDDGGTPPLGTARLSEVDADQLNHVRLQEIDIPVVVERQMNVTIGRLYEKSCSKTLCTHHQGALSTSVRVHVSLSKKVEVDPSTAFCGIPPSATELCIGALPAATFNTGNIKKDTSTLFAS